MTISDKDLKAIKDAFDHMDPEEAKKVTDGLPELKDDAEVVAIVTQKPAARKRGGARKGV